MVRPFLFLGASFLQMELLVKHHCAKLIVVRWLFLEGNVVDNHGPFLQRAFVAKHAHRN